MDAAHELGHLVMHRNLDMGTSTTKEIEAEANRLASAFLIPKSTMLKYTPRGFSLRDAVALKSDGRYLWQPLSIDCTTLTYSRIGSIIIYSNN